MIKCLLVALVVEIRLAQVVVGFYEVELGLVVGVDEDLWRK